MTTMTNKIYDSWTVKVHDIVWGNTCETKFLEVDGNERIARRNLPKEITFGDKGSTYVPEDILSIEWYDVINEEILSFIAEDFGFLVDECIILRKRK